MLKDEGEYRNQLERANRQFEQYKKMMIINGLKYIVPCIKILCMEKNNLCNSNNSKGETEGEKERGG